MRHIKLFEDFDKFSVNEGLNPAIKGLIDSMISGKIQRKTIRVKDEVGFNRFLKDAEPAIKSGELIVKKNPIDPAEVWISLGPKSQEKIQEGTFNSPNSIAIFSGPDGEAEVEKRKDGSYYASCEDYDFEAKDKKEMADKLNKYGFKTLVSGKLDEAHEDLQNYMFFSNLESIKRKCESILAMDFKKIDELLNEGGHDWAADHVAVAKENIDQVEGFLVGQFEDAHQEEPSQPEVPTAVSEKAYSKENVTDLELSAYLVVLHKELSAEDDPKKKEMIKKDIEEVRAELADRKKK